VLGSVVGLVPFVSRSKGAERGTDGERGEILSTRTQCADIDFINGVTTTLINAIVAQMIIDRRLDRDINHIHNETASKLLISGTCIRR
jgi:hypothetical protein